MYDCQYEGCGSPFLVLVSGVSATLTTFILKGTLRHSHIPPAAVLPKAERIKMTQKLITSIAEYCTSNCTEPLSKVSGVCAVDGSVAPSPAVEPEDGQHLNHIQQLMSQGLSE